MSDIQVPTPVLDDFKLLLDLSPEGESGAFVPVRWCLSPEARQSLVDRNVTGAFMLILVAANYGSDDSPMWQVTDKQLVRLTAEMAYVRFNRPGTNRILGLVVWPSEGSVTKMRERVFSSESNVSFSNGHLNEYDLSGTWKSSRLSYIAERDVVVPAGLFAPEPPAWRKKLVRKFFRDREADQCHFRKHFIWSVLWLVPYLVFGTLIRVVYGLFAGVLFGHRKIAWSTLWHPFASDIPDMWSSVRAGRCWWNTDKRGLKKQWYWCLLQPMSYAVLTLVFTVKFSPIVAFGIAVGIHIAFLALCGVIALAIVAINALGDIQFNTSNKVEQRLTAIQRYASELDDMVCTTGNRTVNIDALPADKQTLHLRFNELKSRVCRPFAK